MFPRKSGVMSSFPDPERHKRVFDDPDGTEDDVGTDPYYDDEDSSSEESSIIILRGTTAPTTNAPPSSGPSAASTSSPAPKQVPSLHGLPDSITVPANGSSASFLDVSASKNRESDESTTRSALGNNSELSAKQPPPRGDPEPRSGQVREPSSPPALGPPAVATTHQSRSEDTMPGIAAAATKNNNDANNPNDADATVVKPMVATAGLDDQESASDADDEPSFTCWMCLLPIDVRYHVVRRHPILSVPMCHCCWEGLESLQESLEAQSPRKASFKSAGTGNASKSDDSGEDDNDKCDGCQHAEGHDLLFLCDADACPNQFCDDCVAYAHQGFQDMDGVDRQAIVDNVKAQNPWLCLSCQPPPHLRSLQDHLRVHEEEEEDDDDDIDDEERSENQEITEATVKRKYDKSTHDLVECEEELTRVLEAFETLGPGNPDDSDDAKEYRKLLEHHHICLREKISQLHEDLEGVCGVDLAKWYITVLNEVAPTVDENARPTEDVEAADRENRVREIRERKERKARDRELRKNPQHQKKMDDEYYYKDAEDLELEQGADGSTAIPRNAAVWEAEGWRSDEVLDPEEFEQSRQTEDAWLKDRGITFHRVTEKVDREATRTEARAEKQPRRKLLLSSALQPTESNVPKPTNAIKGKDLPPVESAAGEPQDVVDVEGTAHPHVNGAAMATAASVGSEPDAPPTNPAGMNLLGKGALRRKVTLRSKAEPAATSSEIVLLHETSNDEEVGRFDSIKGPFAGPQAIVLNPGAARVVTISEEIATKLKEHQVAGVKFIWNNCFSDLNQFKTDSNASGKVHGCVLAHNMGLGKSLTTIALIHSLLKHPNLKGRLKTALIVAPVNTLTNWVAEFGKWTGHLESRLHVDCLAGRLDEARITAVNIWADLGGVLLLGEQLFHRMQEGDSAAGKLLRTDILVLDEAHTMLKNSNNKVFMALSKVETNRRILLTGTPLQNNVTEYFRMIHFVKPGAIDGIMDEAEFEKEYRLPIERGLPSDVAVNLKEESVRLQVKLRRVLEPVVHRRGASFLLSDEMHLQQAVLYLRPTREQNRLCNIYKRLQKSDPDLKGFFRMWKDTKKVHNHPGVLTVPVATSKKRSKSPTESAEAERPNSVWWKPFVKDQEELKAVDKGYKMVVLLHILSLSRQLGDKVLVFSTCLSTLDFIESIIQRPNWSSFVPTLEDESIGFYKKNEDYLRIDGSIGSDERGLRVRQFNDGDAMLFLISSRAGGVGINLTAANRVVIFDSDFNPTIATQCVARAFRYGQSKPVFCYRLLTEGKMEEKIYARSITKQFVSDCVIDGMESMSRFFTAQELEDIQHELFWFQCDRCDRWRSVPPWSEDELPTEWYCEMNDDVENNSCEIEEREPNWYEERLQRANGGSASMESTGGSVADDEIPESVKQDLVQKDTILQHLLGIKASKRTSIVSRFEFHEVLLDADDKGLRRDSSDATHGSPAGGSAKKVSTAARLKEDSSNVSTTKKRSTATPSNAPNGASSPANSMSGLNDGPKRGPPPVGRPPPRKAKQAKPSPSLPASGQRPMGVARAAETTKPAASSRKAPSARASSDEDEPSSPSKKMPRVAAASMKRQDKTRGSADGATKPAAAPSAQPEVIDLCQADEVAKSASEPEVIDLCDSD